MTTKRISKSLRYSLVSTGLAWCVMNGNSHLVHASEAIRQAVPVSPYGEESGIFSDEPFYIDYTITAPEDWVYGSPDDDGYPFAFNQDIENPFWYLQNSDEGVHHPGTSPANEKLLIVGGYCDPSTAADLCTVTNGEEYEGGFSKGYIEYRFTEPGTLTMHILVQTADTAIMSPDDTVCSETASGYIATACLTYVMGMTGGASPTVAPTTSVTPPSLQSPLPTTMASSSFSLFPIG